MNIELNTIVKLWLDIFDFCPAPKKQNVQENDKRFPVKQKTHQKFLTNWSNGRTALEKLPRAIRWNRIGILNLQYWGQRVWKLK